MSLPSAETPFQFSSVWDFGRKETSESNATAQWVRRIGEYSAEDRILDGRILGIRDVVTFEGSDVASLESNFAEAVEEYLSFCRDQGKAPAQPFSGTFNVRTGVDLHRRAALYAESHG